MAGGSRPIRSMSILMMVIAGLTGCGGGGGDSGNSGGSSSGAAEGPVVVSLLPRTVTHYFQSDRQSPEIPVVSVHATVSNAPTTPVYPVVLEDKPVLQPGLHSLTLNPNGSFSASLPLNPDLPVGRHTGTLTLLLCRDPACASTYAVSGGELPYEITVTPGVRIEVLVNGVTRSGFLSLRDGDVLSLQTSQPVRWMVNPLGAEAVNQVSTSTNWSATVRYTRTNPSVAGSLLIFATAESGAMNSVTVSVAP